MSFLEVDIPKPFLATGLKPTQLRISSLVDLAPLEATVSALGHILQQHTKFFERLWDECESVKARQSEFEVRIGGELSGAKERILSLETSNKDLLKAASHTLAETERKLDKVDLVASARVDAERRRVQQEGEQLRLLSQRIDEEETMRRLLSAKISEMETQLNNTQRDTMNLNGGISALTKRVEPMEETIGRNEIWLKSHASEIASLQSATDKHSHELLKVNSGLVLQSHRTDEIEILKAQLMDNNSRLGDLTQQLSRAHVRLIAMQEDLKQYRTEMKDSLSEKADLSALKPLRRVGLLQEELETKAEKSDVEHIRVSLRMLADAIEERVKIEDLPAQVEAQEIVRNSAQTHPTSELRAHRKPQPENSFGGALTSQKLHCLTCDRPLPQTEPREMSTVTNALPSHGSSPMPRILYRIRPSVANRVQYATSSRDRVNPPVERVFSDVEESDLHSRTPASYGAMIPSSQSQAMDVTQVLATDGHSFIGRSAPTKEDGLEDAFPRPQTVFSALLTDVNTPLRKRRPQTASPGAMISPLHVEDKWKVQGSVQTMISRKILTQAHQKQPD